ncbi:MAG: SufE family protein [Aquisalinus sp.]|nr:SufE family protein [Aquisalinus sp.]
MPDFETIVDDFSFLDDWEERYKYIIDLGNQLAPLNDDELTEANKVRGCASQVWLTFDAPESDTLKFRGESDAHIVRGLIALLIALYDGQSKADAVNIDPKAELAKLDLEDHITPQRSNGLVSMIERIRRQAGA